MSHNIRYEKLQQSAKKIHFKIVRKKDRSMLISLSVSFCLCLSLCLSVSLSLSLSLFLSLSVSVSISLFLSLSLSLSLSVSLSVSLSLCLCLCLSLSLSRKNAVQIINWLVSNAVYYVGRTHYDPVGNYLFKVNNRNTRRSCETCSKTKIKIQ